MTERLEEEFQEGEDHKLLIACDGEGNGVVLEYRGRGPTTDIEEDRLGPTDLGDMGLNDAPRGLSVFEATRYADPEHGGEGYMDGDFRPLTTAEWQAMMSGTPLFTPAAAKE